MGRIFGTRFGRGGTLGGGRLPVDFDGYSRDEKLNEKINSLAVHGHQKTKRHTTTNRKDSVGDGGKCYNEMGPRRNLWGDDFTAFGVANDATKN